MAFRIPWDKQETALLIDAYTRVKNNELSQTEAIREVSFLLRRRAMLSGLEIDGIFRNVNGITMQMKIIRGLMEECPSGLHEASRMFKDMVDMKKCNPLAFNTILIQARKECGILDERNEEKKKYAADYIRENNSNTLKLDISEKTIEYSEKTSETDLWKFSDEDLVFSDIAPVSITYFGEKKIVQGWIEAITKIVIAIYEDYPSTIQEIAGCRLGEVNTVVVADDSGLKELNEPVQINEHLYIETDFYPYEMVTIIRCLMDKCNMDYNYIEIEYTELLRNCEIENVDDSNEEAIICEAVNDDIVQVLEKMQIPYVDNRKNKGCLWIIGDRKLLPIVIKFRKNNVFFHYKAEGGRATKKQSAWWTKDIVKQVEKTMITNMFVKDEIDVEQNNVRSITSVYDGKKAFIDWLMNVANLAVRSAHSYCSAVNVAGRYSVRWGLSEKELFLIINAEQVFEICKKLFENPEFIKLNEKQHNRYRIALYKYYNYCKSMEEKAKKSECDGRVFQDSKYYDNFSSISMEVREKYNTILTERFSDGFRPKKIIDRDRFKIYYQDMFGEELTEDGESITHALMEIGTLRGERIYAEDKTAQKELLEKINETIVKTFNEGASCIYLECLFGRFQEQIAEKLHIYNIDLFESTLFSLKGFNYYKKYSYLADHAKKPDPQKDVIDYMEKALLPVTYSEIEKDLWYIPLAKVKNILTGTENMVKVASDAYLCANNLPINEEEIFIIEELINQALLQHSYISDAKLERIINEHCQSLAINTKDYAKWGIRNALAYILREKFSFNGAIISNKNEKIRKKDIFSDFCQRSEHTTLNELKALADELDVQVEWESVYHETIRTNQNDFIRKDQIQFDIDKIDAVLDSLIQDEYAPIKSINLFLHFPTIDVPWNGFVLQSYVLLHSKKFRLLYNSFTNTDCCGAIVRKNSVIADYRTLIVDVLAKNAGWENDEEALQLLVDLGYQQRKNYYDIKKVMEEAKATKEVINKI